MLVDSLFVLQLWDGVSNRCVNTFQDSHEGASVATVRFSKNTKYVLSSGRDSKARLWELSSGQSSQQQLDQEIDEHLN